MLNSKETLKFKHKKEKLKRECITFLSCGMNKIILFLRVFSLHQRLVRFERLMTCTTTPHSSHFPYCTTKPKQIHHIPFGEERETEGGERERPNGKRTQNSIFSFHLLHASSFSILCFLLLFYFSVDASFMPLGTVRL